MNAKLQILGSIRYVVLNKVKTILTTSIVQAMSFLYNISSDIASQECQLNGISHRVFKDL